jgi:hypothetical protein
MNLSYHRRKDAEDGLATVWVNPDWVRGIPPHRGHWRVPQQVVWRYSEGNRHPMPWWWEPVSAMIGLGTLAFLLLAGMALGIGWMLGNA